MREIDAITLMILKDVAPDDTFIAAGKYVQYHILHGRCAAEFMKRKNGMYRHNPYRIYVLDDVWLRSDQCSICHRSVDLTKLKPF